MMPLLASKCRRIVRCVLLPFLAAVFSATLQAQITVSIVSSSASGSVETPVVNGGRFLLGSFAAGDTTSITLRVRNTSNVPIQVGQYTALGSGFQLIAPNTPFPLGAGGLNNATRDAILKFVPTGAASYSGNLRIDTCASAPVEGCTGLPLTSFTATLLANGVLPPELTVFPVCTGMDPNTVLFGTVQRGSTRTCNFNLRNPTAALMTISTFSVTGGGFSDSQSRTAPFTIAAGQTISFSVQFTSNQVGFKTGTLQIETQSYILTATNVDPPLPKPIIEFDGQAASGQQRQVSLRLPSASPFTASGALIMTLLPDSPLVSDDRAVTFITGLRQVAFTVTEGSTQVLIGGQPSITFQTGTTSGKIRFSLSGIATGFASDPTTDLVIPRVPIVVDVASANHGDGLIYVDLTGYDNTYSAGVMSFSFYDANGALVQTVPASFAGDFQKFFSGGQTGSAFRALFGFPVNKAADAIHGVEVELTNGAGTVRTTRATF
jgi:hypothetical protein